jgi:ribosome-associated heat shock protein Hsp15
LRLDKWLWAARFFKTRGLAQAAIAGGKVKLGGERVKAAKEIAPGDGLTIRIGEFEWAVTVRALSSQRGPAEAARKLYEEDEASRARRAAGVADRRAQASVWGERKGRPTKRERREMEKARMKAEG